MDERYSKGRIKALDYHHKSFARGLNVVFMEHAWERIHGWCQAAKTEVSGMGMVRQTGESEFEVYDVYLPDQDCTSGSTELNRKSLDELQMKLIKKGKSLSEFKLWWHTHYNFDVFWSGIDTDNQEGMLKDWLLSIVINQRGEWLTRLDARKPVRFALDDITVYTKKSYKPKNNYKREIENRVKVPEPIGIGYKLLGMSKKDAAEVQKYMDGFDNDGGYQWLFEDGKWNLKKKNKSKLDKLKDKALIDAYGDEGAYLIADGKVMTNKEYQEMMMR